MKGLAGGWPNWVLGNHDRSRVASRIGPDQARVAAMLLLTLRGTPTLYQGEEIGMTDVPIPPERVQDPWEKNVPGLGALPARRGFIPNADGSQRPLAIAALEDKIVQRATAAVLNAIYEEDFLGFSYGFRPGRGAHGALDALAVGITRTKVSHILDADIRSFFDAVSQEWLLRFLTHRIGDPRILRLIRKWLNAGVLEDGVVSVGETGTGQGSVISPLLANVYLHYVFDLWAERWRRREARGDMMIVRYADTCATSPGAGSLSQKGGVWKT